MKTTFYPGHLGTRLAVHRLGTGRPVILLHGLFSSAQVNWIKYGTAAQLAEAGFEAIMPDLRAHGQSDAPHDPAAYPEDVLVADALAVVADLGLTDYDLVGFSLGGLIAMWFALEHPDRINRLALLSTVAERSATERARVIERADKVRNEGIASVVSAAEDRWFTPAFKAKNPEKVALRLEQLKANDLRSYAAAYRVFAEADEGVALNRIRQPTLVMTGENDIGSNPRMARRMHEAISDSRLVILPELRHSVLMEAPDLIADHLLEFLE